MEFTDVTQLTSKFRMIILKTPHLKTILNLGYYMAMYINSYWFRPSKHFTGLSIFSIEESFIFSMTNEIKYECITDNHRYSRQVSVFLTWDPSLSLSHISVALYFTVRVLPWYIHGKYLVPTGKWVVTQGTYQKCMYMVTNKKHSCT